MEKQTKIKIAKIALGTIILILGGIVLLGLSKKELDNILQDESWQ